MSEIFQPGEQLSPQSAADQHREINCGTLQCEARSNKAEWLESLQNAAGLSRHRADWPGNLLPWSLAAKYSAPALATPHQRWLNAQNVPDARTTVSRSFSPVPGSVATRTTEQFPIPLRPA